MDSEITESSSAHCTMAEGEPSMDLELWSSEGGFVDFYSDLPPLLPPCSEPSVTPIFPFSPERAPIPKISPERAYIPKFGPERASVPELSPERASVSPSCPGRSAIPKISPERAYIP